MQNESNESSMIGAKGAGLVAVSVNFRILKNAQIISDSDFRSAVYLFYLDFFLSRGCG